MGKEEDCSEPLELEQALEPVREPWWWTDYSEEIVGTPLSKRVVCIAIMLFI